MIENKEVILQSRIEQLESEKAELLEVLKFIAEQEDSQYIIDILKKHGVKI